MIMPLKTVAGFAFKEVIGTLAVVGLYALTFVPIDVPTAIIALGMLATAIGTLITAIRTSRTSTTVKSINEKVDTVDQKVDTVGKSVDGAASAQVATVKSLQAELTALREQLAEKREMAVATALEAAHQSGQLQTAHAEGKAAGVEQERARTEDQPKKDGA